MAEFEQADEAALAFAAAKVEAAVAAVKSCKCSTRWVDEACILRAISLWIPSYWILCSGCFFLRDSQRDHQCFGFLSDRLMPDHPNVVKEKLCDRTAETLGDPKIKEALFKIHLQCHYDATQLQQQFAKGLQHLIYTQLENLKTQMLEKDRQAGYRSE